MSGFIDPQAPLERRLDALEVLIEEALATLDESALSPEARTLLAGIRTGNEQARWLLRREMDLDPLPAPTPAPRQEPGNG